MPKRIKRATFLKGMLGFGLMASGGIQACNLLGRDHSFPVRMLGPSMELGHLLRDGAIKAGAGRFESESTGVTIIGAGISGLSAGWWLKKQGFDDFQILELEEEPGGNSQSSKNEISAFPWGAHYIPLANKESEYVREIFKEFGIIESEDENGLAKYNPLYLCHDPEERLFKDGSFQEGLVPKRGLRPDEQEDLERFFKKIVEFRGRKGRDGKPVFAIPLDLSSRDEEFLRLDHISMDHWLKENDFKSKPLLWYVNYCCRDDYGTTADNVSAWAGIHYFAGRRGIAGNAEQNAVVTWPEGNGFIVQKFKELLGDKIHTGAAAFELANVDSGVRCMYMKRGSKKVYALQSDYAIFASPRPISKYVLKDREFTSDTDYVDSLNYPPWIVANISLDRLPSARGISSAWDNVGYYSDSLGYVVATHQNITTRKSSPTVITYYYPLSHLSSREARSVLARSSAQEWTEIVIGDLAKMHPTIESRIKAIEFWPWGHGMISPSVGYLWGAERRKMLENIGRIYFAHSDMSGISNFEESQYRGVEAAKAILATKNKAYSGMTLMMAEG